MINVNARDYIGNYAILRKELLFWNLENYIFNVDRWKNFRGIRGKVEEKKGKKFL